MLKKFFGKDDENKILRVNAISKYSGNNIIIGKLSEIQKWI